MFVTGFTQDRGACTRLRIWQPLKRIHRLGLAKTHTVEPTDGDVEEILDKTDIAVSGRGSGDRFHNIMRRIQAKGVKVVYDMDDNYMEIHPLSPHYKQLGIMPVDLEHPDGRCAPLWQDGTAGFDIKKNRETRMGFPPVIGQADCVTVSTEPLHKVYSRFNDNVHVVPNALDFRLWGGYVPKHPDGKVRILYTGAANHQEDFLFIREPLEEIQKRHDNVVIVFVGTDWKHMGSDLDYSRIEVHEWVDFCAYPYLIKYLACDIGLAPISVDQFNNCRSELKWMEYSARKMATVATNYGPYKRAMKDGETGLLVMEPEEWVEAISALVEKPRLGEMLAHNAYKTIWRHHNLDFIVEKWMDVFNQLIEEKR